jgi:hypothetical protein
LGHLNSSSATQFADSPFDFLFFLDLEPNPLMLHILAKSKAKCRVGKFWEEGNPYLDLMITSVNTYQGLVDSIYTYVKKLR